MNNSITFIRVLFLLLTTVLLTTYTSSILPGGFNFANAVIGIAIGLLTGFLFITGELFIKRFNLRTFNLAIFGLFVGYLMGQAIMLIVSATASSAAFQFSEESFTLMKTLVFLASAYIGMVMTLRSSDEIHLSIPFVRFKASTQKKKDLLIDSSILLDPRMIDLASSGLLDDHLVMPRFAVKDLHQQAESSDEAIKTKARRCLEVFKKLEGMPLLDIRYSDTDFSETKDATAKLIQLARMLDANIVTADMTKIQSSSEGLRIINIHSLSNALKPLTHAGEHLNIKIQRYGKEPRQGIGYLDDGTMVVVNGGAEFIGETIRAQVLSVKHTSSGRMIFCNTTEMMSEHELDMQEPAIPSDSTHKNYFAL